MPSSRLATASIIGRDSHPSDQRSEHEVHTRRRSEVARETRPRICSAAQGCAHPEQRLPLAVTRILSVSELGPSSEFGLHEGLHSSWA